MSGLSGFVTTVAADGTEHRCELQISGEDAACEIRQVPPGAGYEVRVRWGYVDPALVAVPDVRGLSEAAASSQIGTAGPSVGRSSTGSSSKFTSGVVIPQNPAGGVVVAPDASVDRVVSSGNPSCRVSGVSRLREVKDDKIQWELTNTGGRMVTSERIRLRWPEENGQLKEIDFSGNIFKNDRRDPPWVALQPGDWRGNAKSRRLEVGKTETLEVTFTEESSDRAANEFSITVTFEEGCSVRFN